MVWIERSRLLPPPRCESSCCARLGPHPGHLFEIKEIHKRVKTPLQITRMPSSYQVHAAQAKVTPSSQALRSRRCSGLCSVQGMSEVWEVWRRHGHKRLNALTPAELLAAQTQPRTHRPQRQWAQSCPTAGKPSTAAHRSPATEARGTCKLKEQGAVAESCFAVAAAWRGTLTADWSDAMAAAVRGSAPAGHSV